MNRLVQVGPSTPARRGNRLGLPLTKAMVEANRAQFDIVSAPKAKEPWGVHRLPATTGVGRLTKKNGDPGSSVAQLKL